MPSGRPRPRSTRPGTSPHRVRGRSSSPSSVNEAEGDFAVLGDVILAGHGFRTSRSAHRELAAITGRDVISLELVDPRFYHLDVALTVLDDETDQIAYYPPAFSARSRAKLERLFPDAIIATTADAYAFGLNAVSDGYHVFLPAGADHLADRPDRRRLSGGADRPQRAPQGRRQRQVLHPGAPLRPLLSTDRKCEQ